MILLNIIWGIIAAVFTTITLLYLNYLISPLQIVAIAIAASLAGICYDIAETYIVKWFNRKYGVYRG